MSTRALIVVNVTDYIGQTLQFDKRKLPGGVRVMPFDRVQDPKAFVPRDKREDTTVSTNYLSIYHHWDGYPDGLGKNLKENYDTQEKAVNLILLGDLSTSMHYDKDDNVDVVPYSTREGEDWKNLKPAGHNSFSDLLATVDSFIDYIYLFEDGHWRAFGTGHGEREPRELEF